VKAISTALNEVMKHVGYVQKTKFNEFHRYAYAGEEELLEHLRPALVEAGLILIPSLDGEPRTDENGNTHLVVAYTLAHTSGEVWPEKIRVPGCGNDKNSKGGIGDKGTYKALTGANKYLLFKLFQIATGDDPEKHDANAASEPPRAAAPTKPRAAAAPKVTQPHDWRDDPVGFGKFTASTWREIAQGEVGGRRYSYCEWLRDETKKKLAEKPGDERGEKILERVLWALAAMNNAADGGEAPF